MKKSALLMITMMTTVMVLFNHAVRAESDKSDKDEAKRHFKQGAAFYKEGNYAAALIEFKASYKESPNWKVRYHIAITLHALNKFVEAEEQLKKYMEEGGENVPEDKKASVADLISQISGVIATVDIKTDVKGAGVYCNGRRVGNTPLKEPIRLNLGHYEIKVQKKGYKDYSTEVDLPGGEALTLDIVLEKLEGAEAEEEEMVEAEKEQDAADVTAKGKKKKIKPYAFYAMVGLTGALAVGAIATGVLTMQKHSEFEDTPEDDWQKRNDLIDEGTTLGVTTDVLIGLAAASAAAMVALAFFSDFGKKEKQKTAFAISPGAGGAHLSLIRTW